MEAAGDVSRLFAGFLVIHEGAFFTFVPCHISGARRSILKESVSSPIFSTIFDHFHNLHHNLKLFCHFHLFRTCFLCYNTFRKAAQIFLHAQLLQNHI